VWIEKNGPSWRLRDVVGGKKITVETGYVTKTAAKARLTALTADRLRGDYIDPRGGRVLLDDWIDAWWPSYEVSLKPSSRASEGGRMRNHIRPLLGRHALEDLDGLVIQSWVSKLISGQRAGTEWVRRPLSPKTVRNTHGVLHKLLGAAVGQRLLRANPCSQTRMPKVVHREMRFLTEPEIGRIAAAVPGHWRPLVLMLVATGLRWGEAVALRVQDVDLLTGRLTVLRTLHELAGSNKFVFTEPKSARSRRTVTFPRSVAAEMTPLVVGKQRQDLVFTSPMGQPARVRNFRRGWVKWTVAAGLDPQRAPGERRVEGLRIHDLRHTHAALLISAGVPLTAIQRRLGHSSIAVTSDLYGHLLPAVDEGILTAIDAALELVRPLEPEVVGDAEIAAEIGEG
jgi:integrase